MKPNIFLVFVFVFLTSIIQSKAQSDSLTLVENPEKQSILISKQIIEAETPIIEKRSSQSSSQLMSRPFLYDCSMRAYQVYYPDFPNDLYFKVEIPMSCGILPYVEIYGVRYWSAGDVFEDYDRGVYTVLYYVELLDYSIDLMLAHPGVDPCYVHISKGALTPIESMDFQLHAEEYYFPGSAEPHVLVSLSYDCPIWEMIYSVKVGYSNIAGMVGGVWEENGRYYAVYALPLNQKLPAEFEVWEYGALSCYLRMEKKCHIEIKPVRENIPLEGGVTVVQMNFGPECVPNTVVVSSNVGSLTNYLASGGSGYHIYHIVIPPSSTNRDVIMDISVNNKVPYNHEVQQIDVHESVPVTNNYIPIPSAGNVQAGAYTHTIPIEVPEGTNGVQPNISLVYNSRSGMGLAGYGWHLSGISTISVGAQNMYYDGVVSAPKAGNPLFLDGQRIISEAGRLTLENNRAVRIRQSGRSFYVDYPDGSKVSYSSVIDGYLWRIMSYESPTGNSMSYSYVGQYLNSINYGGNSKAYVTPYASVKFTYEDNPDKHIVYLAGQNIGYTKRIKAINAHIIASSATPTKTYTLTYNDGYYKQLSNVERGGATGASVSIPITYGYGANKYTLNTNEILPSTYYANANHRNILVYTGKLCDWDKGNQIVILPRKKKDEAYKANEKIIIYTDIASSDNSVYQYEMLVGEGFKQLFIANADETPEEEIIKIHEKDDTHIIEICSPNVYGDFYKDRYVFRKLSSEKEAKYHYLVGNFDGSGKNKLMVTTYKHNLTSTAGIVDLDHSTGFLNNIRYPLFTNYVTDDILFTLDYDGDGKTDIAHINEEGLKIYTFIPAKSSDNWKYELEVIASSKDINRALFAAERTFFMGLPRTFNRALLVGDINGDGKTDIMVSFSCTLLADTDYSYRMSEFAWKILISDGNGGFNYSTDSELMGINTAFKGINTDGGAFLQDMNGDGRADIVAVDANRLSVHYSEGNGFSNSNYRIIARPNTEGFVTTVNCMSPNNNRFIAYSQNNKIILANFVRDEQQETFLTKIDLTTVDYGRIDMSGEDKKRFFYDLGNSRAVFPYTNLNHTPLYVVTNAKTSLGSNILVDNDYSYVNAVMHYQGLGFCGFEQIATYDKILGLTATETYEPYRFGLPKKRETPILTTEKTWTITEGSTYPRINKITLNKQKATDKLTGNIQESEYTYNAYGLPILQILKQGTLKEDITTTYESTAGTTDWSIMPKTTTSVKTYSGGTVNNVSTVDYNYLKLPVKVTVKTGSAKDKIVSEENFEYNIFGSVIKHTSKAFATGDALVNQYVYTTNGRFVDREINELGQTTHYTYDNIKGVVLTSKDYKNNTTTYSYDIAGRVAEISYPDGVVQNISYTGSRSLPKQTIVETDKPRVEITYDVFNREILSSTKAFNGNMLNATTEYNAKGQVYRVSELGSTSRFTTYTYDSYGRPTYVTEPSGKITTYTYSGRSTTITEGGFTKTSTINTEGLVAKVTDPAGDINYTYRADGQVSRITAPDGAATTLTYDDYGRQTGIIDPTAGTIRYEYDNNGNVCKQTDARGRITETTYNKYSMPVTSTVKNGSTIEHSTAYTYNTDYVLQNVTGGGTTVSYTYDKFLRVASQTESVAGNTITHTYTYQKGKIADIAYSGLAGIQPPATTFAYKKWGDLVYVKSGMATIKTVNTKNNFGQTTHYILGNGVVTFRNFDANGNIEGIRVARGATVIQDFNYNIDPVKMLMTNRKDNTRNHTETFTYDPLLRLTSYTRPGLATAAVVYNPMGNITAKTDAGTFEYDVAGKPYAVSKQTGNPGSVPPRLQQVSYTGFHRPAAITENGYNVTYTYGPNYDRNKMEVRKNAVLQSTRYYLGSNYEKDIASSTVTEKLYVNGTAYNAPAVYIRVNGGVWTLYYIHRDHLGSITAITNTSGTRVEENSFDPWGRQRDPATKVAYAPDQAPSLMLGRGYTGHEHLPMFGLVNMNARLYDPVLGRFLAADPYVQAPDWSQNFNRYSYCVNNPLMYTDPDGEWFLIDDLIVAAVGGIINVAAGIISGDVRDIGDGLAYFAVGAGAGLATYYGGPIAGAAVLGLGNNAWNQFDRNGYSFKNYDFGEASMATFMSLGTAYLGGHLGSAISRPLSGLTSNIVSPVIREGVNGAITQGVTGFALSGAVALSDKETRGDWLKIAAKGGVMGAGMGLTTGAIGGYKYAKDNGLDRWTGQKKLYRAVSGAELNDIGLNGFRSDPSGKNYQGEKLFYENYKDAVKNTRAYDNAFGQKSTILEIRGLNTSIYNRNYMDGYNVIGVKESNLNLLRLKKIR